MHVLFHSMQVYKERGFVDDLKYECEIEEVLKQRTGERACTRDACGLAALSRAGWPCARVRSRALRRSRARGRAATPRAGAATRVSRRHAARAARPLRAFSHRRGALPTP